MKMIYAEIERQLLWDFFYKTPATVVYYQVNSLMRASWVHPICPKTFILNKTEEMFQLTAITHLFLGSFLSSSFGAYGLTAHMLCSWKT